MTDTYVAGTYSDLNTIPRYSNNTACYWVNNVRIDLAVPEGVVYAVASDINVSETDVYIAGYYFTDDNHFYSSESVVACYWKNGERVDIAEKGCSAVSIAVKNNIIYLLGEYRVGNSIKPCYWINGEKLELELDLPSDYSNINIKNIFTANNKIYIIGNISINYKNQPCYWVDGVRTDISFSFENEYNPYLSCIAVVGETIYKAGKYETSYSNNKEKGFYSVDDRLVHLNIPDETNVIYIYDLTVLDDKIYIVGHYFIGGWATSGLGFHGFQTACYWINGIRTDISPDIKIKLITIADND